MPFVLDASVAASRAFSKALPLATLDDSLRAADQRAGVSLVSQASDSKRPPA